MMRMQEMEGTPQIGHSLSRTIDSIISIVRQSKGQPAPTPGETKVTADELMSLFKHDLAPRAARNEVTEAQERADLDTVRRALYGA